MGGRNLLDADRATVIKALRYARLRLTDATSESDRICARRQNVAKGQIQTCLAPRIRSISLNFARL
jgi:hypothetical protein